MAKFNVHDVALPDIKLTPEREAALIAEVEAVVHNTLELRSAYAAGGRQLDTSAWKLVKTKDDVRAYRSRRALHGVDPTEARTESSDALSSSSSSGSRSTMNKLSSIASSTSSNDSEPFRSKKTARPPAVVLTGTVDGTAEDAVLGMLADSEQHCMMRQSYLGTELDDSRLLFVLARPTPKTHSRSSVSSGDVRRTAASARPVTSSSWRLQVSPRTRVERSSAMVCASRRTCRTC